MARMLNLRGILELKDVTFISEYYSEQLVYELGYWLSVINITRSKQDVQEFAPVIDDQVQFEAEKPAGGGLAPLC